MLTNGARASRLVISNVTTGMDSNRPNFDCQTHELINKCKPRPVDVKGITQNIVGWELDEVGDRGAKRQNHAPGTMHGLVRIGQACLLLEFAWHPDVSARSRK